MLRTITSKVVDEDYETLYDQKVELELSVQATCDIQATESVAQFFNTVFEIFMTTFAP